MRLQMEFPLMATNQEEEEKIEAPQLTKKVKKEEAAVLPTNIQPLFEEIASVDFSPY